MEESKIINQKLDQLLVLQSEAITIEGLMVLTGWSKPYIYKLTCKSKIPHYKPNGKTMFFKKSEIEKYLLSNKQITKSEIDNQARNFVNLKLKKH